MSVEVLNYFEQYQIEYSLFLKHCFANFDKVFDFFNKFGSTNPMIEDLFKIDSRARQIKTKRNPLYVEVQAALYRNDFMVDEESSLPQQVEINLTSVSMFHFSQSLQLLLSQLFSDLATEKLFASKPY